MNIATEFQQVTVFLHQHSLVSPLIKMANPSMPPIVPSRIPNIEMPHKLGKIRFRGLRDKMKVVAHQHIGVKLNAVDLNRYSKLL
jgi:hypothetical protein